MVAERRRLASSRRSFAARPGRVGTRGRCGGATASLSRAVSRVLAALLKDAVAPPQRPRVPTRPGRAANERRLEAKRQRSAIKRGRRPDRRDPE